MELPEIRQALNSLPPETAAKLLREVLDRLPASAAATPEQWSRAASRVIDRYREALERLAK
jgi:hypothetical protein